MPARFATISAEGLLGKLVWLVLAAALGIAGMTFYPQFAQGYEIKGAAKVACNELMRNWRQQRAGEEEAHLEPFLRRAKRAGVKLEPSQYSFTPSHDKQSDQLICKVRITYDLSIEWYQVGHLLQIAPFAYSRVIAFEHSVAAKY